MTPSARRLSRTLIAATAAAAPVVAMAPTAQAAPSAPQIPRTPLPPTQPQLPTNPVGPMPTTPRILPTPAPASQVTMWVNVSVGVNVRTGPSTSYAVVGGHANGTRLTGSLTSNGWLKTGDNRFVHAGNLTTTDPGGGGGGGGGGSTETVTRWVNVSVGVNVRSGPSTSHGVVGGHAYGTRLTGTMTSNGWLQTGSNRFVHAGNLSSTDPGGGGGGGSQTVTQWVRSNSANVRSGPGLNYSVVTVVTRGTQMQGTWTSNGWLDIGGGRFISGSVLTSENPGGGGGGGGTETVTRWVSVPVANVRSGPSTSHSVVGTAAQGQQVQGTLESNGWLRISSSRFMAPSVLTNQQPGPTPAPPPAPNPTRQAILNTAAQYVGYPYILYGTPPNAFDCSSYTWWVYKQNGIDIPRTVRDQRAFVIPVSDPQPGDLIFYHNWYHVGIYAGNGMSYEAQNPSAGVVYGPIWDNAVWYGRVPGM